MIQATTKITAKGLIIWLICACFFIYEFLLRTILGTLQYPIMTELSLSPFTFALLSSSAYQIPYALMQVPVGLITERYGLKKTLVAAVLLCSLANLGFSMSSSFFSACCFRVLIGLGSSFGFICLLIAVYDWMPRKNIAFFIGMSQFIGTLGPMGAAGPLSSLSTNTSIGWRVIFEYLSGIGLVLAVLVFLIVDKNRQLQQKFVTISRPDPIFSTLRQILKQPQVWFVAVYSAFIYFGLGYLSENASRQFLAQKGISPNTTSYMISTSWLGYAIGCAALGYFSDKIQRRRKLMMISASLAVMSLVGIILLPLNIPTTLICFFALGIGAGGQSIGFTVMSEQCKENHLALGLAFNNAMIISMTAIGAPAIGILLSGTNTLSLAQYQHAFLSLIFTAIGAWIISLFFIQETFCKSMRESTWLKR